VSETLHRDAEKGVSSSLNDYTLTADWSCLSFCYFIVQVKKKVRRGAIQTADLLKPRPAPLMESAFCVWYADFGNIGWWKREFLPL
jgi:hypothetical protein